MFISDISKMPVAVSHNIDLGPDLPNEVMDIARKQGEDPERLCADIQELRDMIFGKNEQHLSHYSIRSSRIELIITHVLRTFFLQKEELVSRHARMMTSSFDFCVPDTSSWSIHTIW